MYIYYFIFNKVYSFYKSRDAHPGVYSLAVLVLLQFLTIYGFLILPERLMYKQVTFVKFEMWIYILVVSIINYLIFFFLNTPEKIDEKIKSISSRRYAILKVLSIIHIVITIGLFILLWNSPITNSI